MTLDTEIVKYIFPGAHPTVALGEDGYIVYDFDKVYPARLAVFVPIEVVPSNYSNVFPKSFEDYFRDLDLEISRLSLLIECGNMFNRFPKTEFVTGQFLRREDGYYIVFRFDELLESEEKTELLCRTKTKNLSIADISEIYAVSGSLVPDKARMVDGTGYLYWSLPIVRLFRYQENAPRELIPMMQESLCR